MRNRSCNLRTCWARAAPGPQAAVLVLLVRKYSDTLDRLDAVAAGYKPSKNTTAPKRECCSGSNDLYRTKARAGLRENLPGRF